MKKKISFILGIIGISLLFFNWASLCYPAECYPKALNSIFKPIGNFTTSPPKNMPIFIWIILSGLIGFAFIFVFIFSIIGLLFGVKELKFSSKTFSILGIVLNFLNLCLSLFIAWLLFGLARGL